jgi:hypothetical protein
MSKKNDNIKKEIMDFLSSKGWVKDSYGNYQKKIGDKEFRMKFNDTSVRYELKLKFEDMDYSGPSSEWRRIKSDYYKDLSVSEKGIKGLK